MPRGDRGQGSAPVDWVFPLVGIVAALGLAYGLGRLQTSETETRQQTPAAYRQAAETDAQRACAGIEPSRMFECIYEKVEASQEQSNAEQDLSAQQRAASAALWSAIIAFLTLSVSVVGVWFIKRTLDATLEAVEDTGLATEAVTESNKIARDHAVIQLRAYLTVDQITVGHFSDTSIELRIVLKNYGATPASNIEFSCGAFGETHPLSNPHLKKPAIRRYNQKTSIVAGGADDIRYFVEGPFDRRLLTSMSTENSLYVYGRAEYQDVFGIQRETSFCYRSNVGEPDNDWLVVHPNGNYST